MIKHGEKIKEIARDKGLNNSALAVLVGKTRQSVGYDLKQDFLRTEALKAYCEALGVDLEEFYTYGEKKPKKDFSGDSEQEKEFLRRENESLKRENSTLRDALDALKLSLQSLSGRNLKVAV